MKKRISAVAVFLLCICFLFGCGAVLQSAGGTPSSAETSSGNTSVSSQDVSVSSGQDTSVSVTEDGEYTSKDEVALYIHLYGHLPSNYITKKEAQKLGWNSSEGNLDEIAPGKSIGGSRFGNYDGQLPDGSYKECDIGYTGGYRGADRIIYSSDGRIYYTDDHYKTFEQLY
jgi:ribonuclease T1